MRILQIAGEYYDTVGRGIGSYTHNLSKHLITLGHSVDVIAYVRGEFRANTQDMKIYNVPLSIVPLWRMSKWGFEASAKLSHIVENYDLVNAQMPSSFGYPIFHRSGLPLVVTAHTTYCDPSAARWLKPYAFVIDKLSYRQADHIIAVSKTVREELIEIGVDPAKIEHIPVGVDLKRFYPSGGNEKEKISASLHSNSNSVKLLYVGTINERKGVKYMLEAVRLLPEGVKQHVSVGVIGVGPLLPRYRKIYSSLGNITFYGFVSDTLLPLFYRSADVFVFPSLYEGLPTVVLEAMASGLPIIATNIPSLAEVVNPDFGILVKPRNPRELVRALTFLVKHSKTREEMARNAVTYAKKYDWDYVAKRVSNCYEQLAD